MNNNTKDTESEMGCRELEYSCTGNPLRFPSENSHTRAPLCTEKTPYSGFSYTVIPNYRYCTLNLARWTKRDMIEERGGFNLYGMVGNNKINLVDILGWSDFFNPSYDDLIDGLSGTGPLTEGTQNINIMEELLEKYKDFIDTQYYVAGFYLTTKYNDLVIKYSSTLEICKCTSGKKWKWKQADFKGNPSKELEAIMRTSVERYRSNFYKNKFAEFLKGGIGFLSIPMNKEDFGVMKKMADMMKTSYEGEEELVSEYIKFRKDVRNSSNWKSECNESKKGIIREIIYIKGYEIKKREEKRYVSTEPVLA